jgi:hypothetical protein
MSFRHVNAFGRLVLEDESSVQRGEPSAAVAPGLFLDNLRDVLTPSKLNGILSSAGWRILREIGMAEPPHPAFRCH